MMKRLIVPILCVFASVSALAFGGGGGRSAPGLISTTYKAGVDAIGIHFGGDADVPCPEHSTKIYGLCICDEDYTPDGVGGCVADQCLEYVPTDCMPDCDPITGDAVSGNEGKYCENKTGRCVVGVCVPINCNPCTDLIDGVCVTRTCGDGEVCNTAQNACLCDTENKYYGEIGNCQLCNGTGSIFKDVTCQCDNENNYYGEANNCAKCEGENREIKDNDCVCINGYEEYNNECVEKCADGYQRNQETGACELICTENSDCSDLGTCMGCMIPDGADSGTCQYACQEVEYLESTGTQWIDTDENSSNGYLYKTKIIPLGIGNWKLFYGRQQTTGGGGCDFVGYNGNSKLGASILELGAANTIGAQDAPINNTYLIESSSIQPNIYFQANDIKTTANRSGELSTLNIYLFGINDAGNANSNYLSKIKMYYFQMYDKDGTLVRDFIPVLDPNGTPAMLDRVENKLYYNQGSGQFLYGPTQ